MEAVIDVQGAEPKPGRWSWREIVRFILALVAGPVVWVLVEAAASEIQGRHGVASIGASPLATVLGICLLLVTSFAIAPSRAKRAAVQCELVLLFGNMTHYWRDGTFASLAILAGATVATLGLLWPIRTTEMKDFFRIPVRWALAVICLSLIVGATINLAVLVNLAQGGAWVWTMPLYVGLTPWLVAVLGPALAPRDLPRLARWVWWPMALCLGGAFVLFDIITSHGIAGISTTVAVELLTAAAIWAWYRFLDTGRPAPIDPDASLLRVWFGDILPSNRRAILVLAGALAVAAIGTAGATIWVLPRAPYMVRTQAYYRLARVEMPFTGLTCRRSPFPIGIDEMDENCLERVGNSDPVSLYWASRLLSDSKMAGADAMAVRFLRLAADQDYGPALEQLGLRYAAGRGVAKDDGQSAQYFLRAAEDGSEVAALEIGHYYAIGRGVGRDPELAMRWLRRELDSPAHIPKLDGGAEVDIGRLYANGWGVKQNCGTAQDWYRRAAAVGDEIAIKGLADHTILTCKW